MEGGAGSTGQGLAARRGPFGLGPRAAHRKAPMEVAHEARRQGSHRGSRDGSSRSRDSSELTGRELRGDLSTCTT